MGFFPNYTNIYPELKEVLNTRAQSNNSPWTQGGVSGLSTWVRMVSAVGNGLVMQSVHGPSNFSLNYGDNTKPGILGYELDLKTPVEIDGTGRGLRPSPIITGISIDEKARGALKISKVTVKCFTLEQMNKISEYFLEPGFNVLLEWGWNVNDSWSQRVGGGAAISPCQMAKYDTWKTIKEKRKLSKYQYDATLGIITGGGTKFGEGETYDVDIQLSGAGIVGEYMQTHRGGGRTDAEKADSGNSFKADKIAGSAEAGKVGVTLFKQMYNGLPNAKKGAQTYNWYTKPDSLGRVWPYEGNFVNFDETVREELLEILSQGNTISANGKKIELPASNQDLLDKERFIRLELAVEILNKYNLELKPLESSECETKTRRMEINILDSICGAFPHMWSTDNKKLYIPNTTTPSFSFKQALGNPTDEEPFDYIPYDKLNKEDFLCNLHPIVTEAPKGYARTDLNGSANDPATGESRPVPFAFPCTYALDESVIKFKCDETVEPYTAEKGFWGWTKDLFINYDFFLSCMNKPNYTVRDVLYDMMNGLSSSCNSIWNFQIQERPNPNEEDGPIELCIVDLNFSGDVNTDGITTFQARGPKSPFTSIDFSMSIQGSMMSSVIQKKMSANTQTQSEESMPLFGKVFSTKVDRVGTILNGIMKSITDDFEDDTDPPSKEEIEEAKEDARSRAFEFFAGRAGIVSRNQDRNDKAGIMEKVLSWLGNPDALGIDQLLSVGSWDDPKALKDVELIDKDFNKKIKGEQEKEKNNKQNPPIGLAQVNFEVHGVSGFKVGDKFRVDGIPEKYGAPSFFQIMKVDHQISDMDWKTQIKGELRIIGEES